MNVVEFWNEPPAHAVHICAPSRDTVPEVQGVHEVDAEPLKVPAAQRRQLPDASRKVPAAQGVTPVPLLK